ncbi:MAG TPA: hypothetical protein DCG75_05540 [Bacteroidales bacterium]|jgi:spore coat protein H|nr:hypothetical protein [Bacteroidales bacterium]
MKSKLIILVALVVFPFISLKSQSEIINSLTNETTSNSFLVNQQLNFISTNKKIEHVFQITMSKKDFKKLSRIGNIEKNYLSNCLLMHNDDTLNLKEIELRGRSSMNFTRKSFSIELDDKISINKNGTFYKFNKFNLISLSMDHNYFRNYIAFDLMSHLNLFNLFYTYAEVIINGKTQGIYLMLQKPKDYAFKKENADFMLRRNYENKIKKTYYQGKDSSLKLKYETAFSVLYNELIQKKEGQILYKELSEVLDIEQYFAWMAFNFLIGNRDYTDEVFFYNQNSGEHIKFGIIPWDYDDIFCENPHEGYVIRMLNFGDKLAFSSEDALDYKLISDEYTYKKYLQVLAHLIEEITISELKEVYELCYQELYPFYCKKDILKVCKVDKYGKTNLNGLESDMQNTFNWLVQRREDIAKQLDSVIR